MDNLEKFINEARNIRLNKDEKSAIRQELIDYISKVPIFNVKQSHFSLWFGMLNLRQNFVYTITILLMIMVLTGGGITVGAQKALPGDFLYPIKVGFNEEVKSMAMITDESKANWEIERARRRLQEVEELAVNGSLSEEVKMNLESSLETHIESVNKRINKLENKKNFKAAADVSSNFEVTLRAHEKILTTLAESESRSGGEINPIKVKVGKEALKTEKSREKNEAKISAKMSAKLEANARAKLKTAENKIKEVGKLINSAKYVVNEEANLRAKAKIDIASGAVIEGKNKLDLEAYGEAYTLFQGAIRTADEAKLLLKAGRRLNIDLKINGDDRDNRKEDDNKKEDGSKNENDVGNYLENENKIKIDPETKIESNLIKTTN